MKNYYVLVQGTNCWIRRAKGTSMRYGFFQNHWVTSGDIDAARQAALTRARSDPRWAELGLDSERTEMSLSVREIRLVDSIEDVGSNPSGLNLYRAPRWWEVWYPSWWSNLWPW